jgi:limonene-1,2-epoxide hydrolase
MSNPIDEVIAFFSEWTTMDKLRASIRARFTPQTVWDNVGVSTTVGVEDALGFLNRYEEKFKPARAEVIIKHVAATGNFVFNERIDNFYRADGSRINSVIAVGLLEMDGPRILRFSDYFDARQSGMKPAS